MTSTREPLRWPDGASAGTGDLRVFAANWLVVPPEEAVARAERAALRQAIDRCLRAQREWFDSEARLREAIIARSHSADAKQDDIDQVVTAASTDRCPGR